MSTPAENVRPGPSGARSLAPSDAQNEGTFQSLFEGGALEQPTKREVTREERPLPQAEPEREIPAPQESKAAPEPEPEEAEGPEYSSLDEFLTAQKLDPTTFHTLPVKVKVDGQERLVPLVEVLKNYQLEEHARQRAQEVAESRRQFDTERQAAIQLYQQQLNNAKALGDLAQAQLMGEFQQINWNELMKTDPVQWTVQQQLFSNRSAAIKQHLQDVAAAQEAQSQALREQQAQLLPKEREKMLDAIPEWKDQAKFDSDRKVMSSYAKTLGFSDAELAAIADHRYMQVLHDAASFRALQAQSPETLKRVRAAPTMARPGTRTSRDPKAIAKQQAIERFNKNPRDQDAQAAMFEALL